MTDTRPVDDAALGPAAGGADDPPDPRRWRALTVCLIAGFMTLLDVSIVNVALPSIQAGVDASASALQWVLSGYALSFGLLLVPAGRIGDARGRRIVFLVGLGLFTAASAGVGLAPNAGWLVTFRLLQGAAGGVLTPQVAGLIQQLFRGAERGRAFGLLGTSIGISTAVGPLLGGLILRGFGEDQGWRWIFFVNVPIGLAALPIAARLLPKDRARGRGESLDPVGVVLLGTAIVLLLLPLVEERQWEGPTKWLLVVAALAVLGGFVAWERRFARRAEPLLPAGLLALRSYSVGAALGLAYFAGFTGIFFALTLYLQTGEGYSPLLAGAAVTPFAVGASLTAALGGRLVDRAGRPLVAFGLACVGVGLVATDLVIAGEHGPGIGWWLAGPLLLAGLGSGLVISPNQALTLADVPVARAGTAAGLLQTGQRIGSAVGIAAVGAVFFSRLASSRGDYSSAVTLGLRVSVAFVVVALVLAVADVVAARRRRSRAG